MIATSAIRSCSKRWPHMLSLLDSVAKLVRCNVVTYGSLLSGLGQASWSAAVELQQQVRSQNIKLDTIFGSELLEICKAAAKEISY